jgi:hypothetical protein
MREEMPPESIERYSTKLIKYAARGAWHFSKQQIIFSTVLALLAAPISVYFGLAPSVLAGVLAVLSVAAIAVIGTVIYNVIFHAPAQIYREQQEEIAALKRGTGAPRLAAPAREPEPEPNVTCPIVGFAQVEVDGDHDIVHAGWEHVAIVAEFVNQPEPGKRIGTAYQVFAAITYFDGGGDVCQRVNHGPWMDEDWREVDLGIGDRRRLVLAIQLVGSADLRPESDALRAVENNHESIDRYIAPDYLYLPFTLRRIEVRLFSTSDGTCIGVFTFQVSLGEESSISLVRDK